MKPETKHGATLAFGGGTGIIALALPWTSGLSLLQLLAINEVDRAFPELPIELAVSDSQVASVYFAFYTIFLASSFIIAAGMLQYNGFRDGLRWIRLLSIPLYTIGVLSAFHYPMLPPKFGQSSYGFFLALLPVLVFVLSEYYFEDQSVVRDILKFFSSP